MAEGMAREILARIPLPEERAAVLDLICYRALLRMIPKLRMLGVVNAVEFRRRLRLGSSSVQEPLAWLASLGLARSPSRGNSAWAIPEAVVEACERLRDARGAVWWPRAAHLPKPKPYHPLTERGKAALAEIHRKRAARRAQIKTPT